MKKIVSLVIILAMIFVFGGSTLAAEVSNQVAVNNNASVASKIFTADTEFSDIKKSSDGSYAMETETPYGVVYAPVGRLDVSIKDKSSLKNLVGNYKIPDVVKEAITGEYNKAIKIGNKDLKATYFSDVLLSANNVTVMSIPPATYVYNGANMKNERVYYTGVSTNWVDITRGSGTQAVVSTIKDVALTGIGLIPNPVIAVLSTGISLLQAFKNLYSSFVITGTYQDYATIRLIYDKIDQWTYRQVGSDWYLGLVSERATITKIGSETHFWNSSTNIGKTNTTDRYCSMYLESPNFALPWAIAYQYSMYNAYTEYTLWQINSKTFYF